MSFRKSCLDLAERTIDCCANTFLPAGRREPFRKRFRPHIIEPLAIPASCDKLTAIRATKTGERCVLAGTGPSVGKVDLGKASGEFIFTVNRGYLLAEQLDKQPEAIMLTDSRAFAEYGDAIMTRQWQYLFLNGHFGSPGDKSDDVIWFAKYIRPRMADGFFQNDCTKPLYTESTVSLQALQMAVWMGFSEIVIIGVDLSFDTEKSHFYKPSRNEAARTQALSMKNADAMRRGFDFAAGYIREHTNCRIYNAGDGGALNCFSRVSWEDIF